MGPLQGTSSRRGECALGSRCSSYPVRPSYSREIDTEAFDAVLRSYNPAFTGLHGGKAVAFQSMQRDASAAQKPSSYRRLGPV